MIVASHQPHFNPNLAYVGKMALADVFILSDDVQYRKDYYINRNKIRAKQSPTGWRWLTLPVSHRSDDKINQVRFAHDNWLRDARRIIEFEYRDANYYGHPHMMEFWKLAGLLDSDWFEVSLSEFNEAFLFALEEFFALHTRLQRASTLPTYYTPGDKNGRIISMVQAVGGTVYLAGESAIKNYLDRSRFEQAGIDLLAIETNHPIYEQVHGGEFVPNLGVLDYIVNVGSRFPYECFSYRRPR